MKLNDDVLKTLPEDDVPEEVLAIVRQEDSPGLAVREAAGYVPDEDSDSEDEEVDFARSVLGAFADRECESNTRD